MEFLSILLSGLISLISPVGFVVDQVAENAIRSQFQSVDQLQVRVDNAPVHQILHGRANRVLIAGRGLTLTESFRISTLELEADNIDIDPNGFGRGQVNLRRSLQAGVRLVLSQDDINQAIQAPEFAQRLRGITIEFPGPPQVQRQIQRYDFLNPTVKILDRDRLEISVALQEQGKPEILQIVAQASIQVVDGRRLQLVNPSLVVDGQAAPLEILSALTDGVNRRFDLANLEASGITARVLQVKLTPDQALELAVFVQVEPQGLAWLQSQ
jgi:hypothetical protein